MVGLTAAQAWAKAGLMIRESLDPVAQNVMVALTPGNGAVFQRKLANGQYGYASRTGVGAPQWLALRRSGDTVAGYCSPDGHSWTLLGSCAFVASQPAYVGLAFSTATPTVSRATFDSFRLTPLAPEPWRLADLGAVNSGNLDEFVDDALLVRTAGTGIGGTADSFRFIYQPLPADGRQVVRVAAQTATHAAAKSGVMIRETTMVNSRYVLLAQTPGSGVVLQARTTTGASSVSVATLAGWSAPNWLKLERFGQVVEAWVSADGQSWTSVGQVNWGRGPALLGLATASLNATTSTATVYDHAATTLFSGQRGWSAAYFSSADFSGQPALLRRDGEIDFTWPAGVVPLVGLGGSNYSVRWQGVIHPPADGECRFTVLTTGGVRLRVNGQTVIDRPVLAASSVGAGVATAIEVCGQVSLPAGEPALVELEYVNCTADGRVQLRWSSAAQSEAVIPAEAVQPTDADNDGLPDAWESAHGLNPDDPADASLIPDGDNLPHLAKFQFGLPLGQKAGRVAGGVVLEEWRNLSGVKVADLTQHPRFPGSPDVRTLLTSLETVSNHADNYGQRIRGYLVAPQDGVYQFWLAADDSAELWLSPSDSPFERVKIATVSTWSAPRAYDQQAAQKSVPITLQAGHYYYFEVLQKEGGGLDHLSVAWTRPGAARAILDGAYLATFPPSPDDPLGEGLPETWRASYGLVGNSSTGAGGAYGDFDGDKLSNLAEYQTQTRPDLADTDGDGASDLGERVLATDPFVADAAGDLPAAWQLGAVGGRSLVWGGRRNDVVGLWTDATAFTGGCDAGGIFYQRVAGDFTCDGRVVFEHMSQADLEVGVMVRASLAVNAPFMALTRSQQGGWNLRYREFADGRVLMVQLTGALAPHLNQVAVKRVGSIISLYGQTGTGACRKLADYPLNLGQAEALVGFVGWGPASGAFAVGGASVRQAAAFLVGPAEPTAASTGLAEFDSAKWMGEWDGLVAPASIGAVHVPALGEITAAGGRLTSVLALAGSAVDSSRGSWTVQGESLVGQDRRGELTWRVSLTEASVYLLELTVREGFAGKPETSHFPLKLLVDGEYVDTKVVSANATQPSSALWFSPWLPAGSHTVRVIWDGAQDYTQLQVDALNVFKIEDEDADGNGVADWIDRRLHLFNGVETPLETLTSAISPLPLEGRARWPGLTQLKTYGLDIPVMAGAGYRWFAEIPLRRDADTPVNFTAENGGVRRPLTARWVPHPALAGGTINLKTGSRLLVSVEAGLGEVASLTRAGVPVPLVAGVAELAFPTAGTYHLVGRVSGPAGQREADTVVTVFAPPSLPAQLPGLLTRERIMTRPTLATGVTLEADPRLNLAAVAGSTTQMAWEADDNVNRRMVARIGTTGQVLAATDAPGTAVYSTLETYTRRVSTFPDGTTDNETLIIMSPVRPGYGIKVEIFVAGVVFDDGTRVKLLTPAELDELGQVRLHILRPPNATTSICHRTMLTYQGAVIGTK